MPRSLSLAILAGFCLTLGAGCKPDYPKCKKDKHCKESEFCINGLCQQCRDDKDCSRGQICNQGRCEMDENACETRADCSGGQACVNGRCMACTDDSQCAGGRCRDGRCLESNECVSDQDCPENHECDNGLCVGPPSDAAAGPCQPEPIYFGFDEFVLSATATSKLQQAAKCIQSVSGRSIRIEGHCDPRGTEEYNLALGDRRARSVVNYINRIGVQSNRTRAVSKGKLEARGTDDSSWALDRKVLFIWE